MRETLRVFELQIPLIQMLLVATAGDTDAARRAGSRTASDDSTHNVTMPAGK